MKNYTVKILRNETGEELLSKEFNTMIAGIAAGNDASAVLIRGTDDETVIAINVVESEIDRVFER